MSSVAYLKKMLLDDESTSMNCFRVNSTTCKLNFLKKFEQRSVEGNFDYLIIISKGDADPIVCVR